MADRPTKRLRRLSTDEDIKVSSNEDRANTSRDGGHGRTIQQSAPSTIDNTSMPRAPRRGVTAPAPLPPVPTTATVKHSQAPPTKSNPSGQRSIRLTVKAPPSKLREVITAGSAETAARQTLSRNSKNRKPIVESSSEDEDEDVEMKDAGDEDDEEEDDEDVEEEEEEEDDEDEVPGATISVRGTVLKPPTLRVTAPTRAPSPGRVLKIPPKVESVESKEARLDTGRGGGGAVNQPASDDEELSDLGSDEDEDEEEADEDDEEEELEDEEADSGSSADDSELPPLSAIQAASQNLPGRDSDTDDLSGDDEGTSRAETPDPNKLTRRQRRGSPTSLLALSNEAQKKKHFTAEQITMRRAEMARRRKDLSEKRAAEEKADTLKRLLEKPSGPKRRSRAQVLADLEREEFGLERPGYVYGAGTPGEEGAEEVEERVVRARPGWSRTVARVDATRVAVPEEWLEGPVGRLFEAAGERREWKVVGGSRMVQVVE